MPDPIAPADPAAPITPPAPPAPPAAQVHTLSQEALDDRIARAKKSALVDLGFKDAEEAKAALAAKKKIDDEAKSAAEREVAREKELDALALKAGEYKKTIEARAARELAALTDAQRKAITDFAGEDAAKQLSAIDAFAPTWGAQPAPATPAAPVATTTTLPAPGSSAPTNPAPPPPVPNPQTNLLATYNDLRAKNPMRAAEFRIKHRAELKALQGS